MTYLSITHPCAAPASLPRPTLTIPSVPAPCRPLLPPQHYNYGTAGGSLPCAAPEQEGGKVSQEGGKPRAVSAPGTYIMRPATQEVRKGQGAGGGNGFSFSLPMHSLRKLNDHPVTASPCRPFSTFSAHLTLLVPSLT